MKVHMHRFVVVVATLDPNPGSVACTIDGALSNLKTDHPKGRILSSSAQPEGESHEETIPDEPTAETGITVLGRPYDDYELSRASDDWWNEYVHDVCMGKWS